MVTPFVGVWIETIYPDEPPAGRNVTPFVGVWIETLVKPLLTYQNKVTPFVGVWIETQKRYSMFWLIQSHTLRGCVD